MPIRHPPHLQTARVFPINVDAKASNVNVKIERLYRQSGRVSALSATRTNLDRVAGLYMDNPNAILVANAGNDVNLMVVDTNNRQLHPPEKTLAQKLAKQSKGKYTIAEIENALRAARNNDLNEGVDKGLYVALNTNMSANEVYDTTGMIMTPDGKFLVQSGITTPSADIVSFIQQHTGNTYSWGATTSPVATVDYNNMIESNFLNSRNSCLGECGAAYDVKTGKYMWVSANIMGQVATASQFGGTIGMYEPHSALEDTKILAGTAAAATLAIVAPQVVIASPTTAAISAGTSGTVNAVTQYIKHGEILYPAELISSTVLGGVAGPLMANSQYIANIVYGGSFATANSAFLNSYYTPEERTPDDLATSFFFGGLGGFGGKYLDSTLSKYWISDIPQYIRPQGYNSELGALLNPATQCLAGQY